MRTRLSILAASFMLLASASSQVAAAEYRYCLQGEEFPGGAGDCSFSTYQQCQATASGRMASCAANFAFPGVSPAARNHSRHH